MISRGIVHLLVPLARPDNRGEGMLPRPAAGRNPTVPEALYEMRNLTFPGPRRRFLGKFRIPVVEEPDRVAHVPREGV